MIKSCICLITNTKKNSSLKAIGSTNSVSRHGSPLVRTDPFQMVLQKSFKNAVFGQVTQLFVINEDTLPTSVLNLDLASMNPILRMVNQSGSDHFHVGKNNIAQKVFPLFDNRGMIAVFPKCAFSFLDG